MELNDSQELELKVLDNMGRPMSIQEFERRDYLRRLRWHNDCPNPKCVGHHGSEDQTNCPNCNSKLFKLSTL